MNKVEFNEQYELTVNGEKLDLEQIFCALMRRTSSIPGIGPGSPKHYQKCFGEMIAQLGDMIDFLENERSKHRMGR